MSRGKKFWYATYVCPRCNVSEVTDHHPWTSPASAAFVAAITYKWRSVDGRITCPSCVAILESKDAE